jgi:type I restriction enzyme M protein
MIIHGNLLEKNVRDYSNDDRFDIIFTPPYGGSEKESVKIKFPANLCSSETPDLFMSVIMYRLKKTRTSCGNHSRRIPVWYRQCQSRHQKETARRLQPAYRHLYADDVFALYTNITTNILFFDREGKTRKT